MHIQTQPTPSDDYAMVNDEHKTETTNGLDAGIDANAFFTIYTEPVSIDGGRIPLISSGMYKDKPERVAQYRMLNGEPVLLNVVHPSHPTSGYEQLVDHVEGLFPNRCTHFRVLDQGKRFMATYDLGESYNVGTDSDPDIIKRHIMIGGSHNSTWPSFLIALDHRLFCANQASSADSVIKIKRSTNHDVILLERSTVLAASLNRKDEFFRLAQTLRGIKVTMRDYVRILDLIVPRPEEDKDGKIHGKTLNLWEFKRSAIRYYFAEESNGPASGTAWALWNAVQSAETQELIKSLNVDTTVARQVDQLRGGTPPLTKKIEQALLELV